MPQIDQMTRTEKLRMMEALWQDLSSDEAALVPPVWHEDALKEAEQAHAAGQTEFIDWQNAKGILRNGAA
jgi:hypothetical protein